MAMRDVGIDVVPGSGVAAAAEYYRSTAPKLAPREGTAVSPDARAVQASPSNGAAANAGLAAAGAR
jgi:hypothetical protein